MPVIWVKWSDHSVAFKAGSEILRTGGKSWFVAMHMPAAASLGSYSPFMDPGPLSHLAFSSGWVCVTLNHPSLGEEKNCKDF